jgi:hypothetical protein
VKRVAAGIAEQATQMTESAVNAVTDFVQEKF